MPGNLGTLPTAADTATWPTPDYIHPHNQRTWLVPFAITLMVIVGIIIPLRLFLRITKRAGPFGLDDVLIIPGYLMTTLLSIIACIAVLHWGSDRHLYDVQPDKWQYVALGAWIATFAFLVGTTCIKVSILLFHRRLSDGIVSPIWKYATVTAIWLTVLYGVAFTLVLILNCNPTEAYWRSYDLTYKHAYHCADTRTLNVVSGVLSTISDLYSVVLPIGMLQHFDAPKRQKIALICIFALGLFVVVAGALRTHYISNLSFNWDSTWSSFDVYLWTMLEMQLGLVCASAPALRVFVHSFRKSGSSRSSLRSNTYHGEGGPYQNPSSYSVAPDGNNARTSYSSLASSQGAPIHSRDASYDEKPRTQYLTQSTLDPVKEHNYFPLRSAAGSEGHYPIKTPADFEACALKELQKTRQAPVAHKSHVPQHDMAARLSPGNMGPEVVHQNRFQAMNDPNQLRPQSMRSTLSGPFEDPFTNPYPS